MSFVKLSAGKRGHAPAHDVTAPPPSTAVTRLAPSSSSPDDEGKSQQAADCSGCAWAGGGSKSPILYYERSNPLCRKPCVGVASSSPSLSSARPRSSKRFFIDGGGGGGDGGAAAAAAAGGLYSDNSCSVCLDDYEEGDELLQVTCGHVFHRACIDHWLKAHRVCPCCRTDLDKLAQVVQLFPQISKRSLQNALARAEGNIVLAVEFLLTRAGGDGSTPNAGSGEGDSRGDGGREAVEVSSSAATAAATEHDDDDDDDDDDGACQGGGETASRKPRWGGGYVVSPYSAMAARGGNPALLRSGGFLQGGGLGRRGGGGGGGGYGSQATTPRASIDPSLDAEEGGDDVIQEEAVGTSASHAAVPDLGVEETQQQVLEAGVARGGSAEGEPEYAGGGIRAGEVGAAAGAAAAAVAAAVVAGAGTAGETAPPPPSAASVRPMSAPTGGMAGAFAWRRRSASLTAA
ncbi:unnamed protein product, partial [Ectocarpus sp. 12 AP-2014]